MRRALVPTCLAICLCTSRAALADEFYAISRLDRTLHRIGTGPVSSVAVGQVALPGADLSELVDAGPGFAFTVDRNANRLIRIRLADAAVVGSVQLDQDVWVTRRGFDLAPDGTLWGVLPGLQLRRINTLTGQTTLAAPITGATIIEAIAFSPQGTLYAVGDNGIEFSRRLYTLDTTTGAASFIASLPITDVDTLTWGADGFLYGADSGGFAADLYQIHPATGQLTVVGNTGIFELNGLLAIPAPGGAIVLGAAIALAGRRRRRGRRH